MNIYLPNGRCQPGFRFSPDSDVLVMWYLKRKVLGETLFLRPIVEVEIYKHDPWDLPKMADEFVRQERKWYFFCPYRNHGRGRGNSRETKSGYWKGTGKAKNIMYERQLVATRKTLVFYVGKSNAGTTTNWVMHEYKLENQEELANHDSFTLCEIYEKPGPGPQNGAEYGAPFRMDMWDGIYKAEGEARPNLKTEATTSASAENHSAVSNLGITENAIGLVPHSSTSANDSFKTVSGVTDNTGVVSSKTVSGVNTGVVSSKTVSGVNTGVVVSSKTVSGVNTGVVSSKTVSGVTDNTGVVSPTPTVSPHPPTFGAVSSTPTVSPHPHTSGVVSSTSTVSPHPHTSGVVSSTPTVSPHRPTTEQVLPGIVLGWTNQTPTPVFKVDVSSTDIEMSGDAEDDMDIEDGMGLGDLSSLPFPPFDSSGGFECCAGMSIDDLEFSP